MPTKLKYIEAKAKRLRLRRLPNSHPQRHLTIYKIFQAAVDWIQPSKGGRKILQPSILEVLLSTFKSEFGAQCPTNSSLNPLTAQQKPSRAEHRMFEPFEGG
jgi:hypothetical protein